MSVLEYVNIANKYVKGNKLIMEIVNVMDLFKGWMEEEKRQRPIVVNIRGCNGAGKSTIPIQMAQDGSILLSWFSNRKERAFATYFPKYNTVALGTYLNKTGGLDTYPNNETTRKALELLWLSPFDIIMEGVIASTIKSTYAELFHRFLDRRDIPRRELAIVSIVPPVQVCLDRIQLRNGGIPIKTQAVISKWHTVNRNVEFFAEEGFNSVRVDNSDVELDDTLNWFNNILTDCVGRGFNVTNR